MYPIRPYTRSYIKEQMDKLGADRLSDTHEQTDNPTDDTRSVASHRSHHGRVSVDQVSVAETSQAPAHNNRVPDDRRSVASHRSRHSRVTVDEMSVTDDTHQPSPPILPTEDETLVPEARERSTDPNVATDDRRSLSLASHRSSHHSRVSSISRASSISARRDALVEAAATNTALEYEQMLANKKRQLDSEIEEQQRNQERQRAEQERQRADQERQQAEQERELAFRKAESEREIAVLAATKEAAIAKAKLLAIEQAIREEDDRSSHTDSASQMSQRRTEDWVRSHTPDQMTRKTMPIRGNERHDTCLPDEGHARKELQHSRNSPILQRSPTNYHAKDTTCDTTNASGEQLGTAITNAQAASSSHTECMCKSDCKPILGFAGNAPVFIPGKTCHGQANTPSESISLASVSGQLAASLARQSLPKYEPDVFDGDVTLFYPWKASFQTMLQDAQVTAAHELTLLRKFTKGDPQKIVDSFRKRLYQNSDDAVRDVWASLDAKFGNTAAVANAYLELLDKGAKFNQNDFSKLQDFASICADVKCQTQYLSGLRCLDFGNVLQPTIDRLPTYLRVKWEKIVVDYAKSHTNDYPPFNMFAELIQDQSDLKNHPNIHLGKGTKVIKDTTESMVGGHRKERQEHEYRILKSETDQTKPRNPANFCPIHEMTGHNLTDCYIFKRKSWDDKSDIIKKAGLCSRCLIAKHSTKDCKVPDIKCETCDSSRHRTVLHMEPKPTRTNVDDNVHSLCTAVCGGHAGGFSCSKMLLVDVYPTDQPECAKRVYAIVDDQSNACMIAPELIDTLGVDGCTESYFLSTCSGLKETKYGRRITGLVVRSVSGVEADLPVCIECDSIPSDKREIPSSTVAKQFPHLRKIANKIPDIDNAADVSLLIGRNAPELLKVRSFINGPSGAPWAQELTLGWTLSGQACLDKTNGAVHIIARKTSTTTNELDDSSFARKTSTTNEADDNSFDTIPCPNAIDVSRCDVFQEGPNDNEVGMSQEDKRFMKLMDESYHKNGTNNCEMPLPLRDRSAPMPHNRHQALKRLNSLQRTFSRKPGMKDDYRAFMKNIFVRNHASVIGNYNEQNAQDSGTIWYLPHFGVYHPKKPTKIRVVFDAAAEYSGVSLNKALLSGPDQMNCLLGVLIRFRKENIALMCDIEQMFHGLFVDERDRDLLRFLWYKDHDTDGEIIDCRMNVHIFGNVSSPAVATYGLRRTANEGRNKYGSDACAFVNKSFYVDDGLISCSSESEAITLIKNTQDMLLESNLRLHKIASNSTVVMNALPEEDRANGLQELNVKNDVLPSIRSLGVMWNMATDSFSFRVNVDDKPFSRRGLLSVINSVYDPLGIAAPVIITGKLILQQANVLCKDNHLDRKVGWDDPLPDEMLHRWQTWKNDLVLLETVSVPRCYHIKDFGSVIRTEIHAFSDASKDATGVAIYLRQLNAVGDVAVSLVFGQAKVAPIRLTTIPRLELCAAVMATEATQKISNELHQSIDAVHYYTDSKIVLGYIQNNSRRFHMYVANRVQRIRDASSPPQWHYVDTSENPADVATRGVRATKLKDSLWLNGPGFLTDVQYVPSLVEGIPVDQEDPDVRNIVKVHCTNVNASTGYLGTKRFERFSNWTSACRALGMLITFAKRFTKPNDNVDPLRPTNKELQEAERILIENVQQEEFDSELVKLKEHDAEGNTNFKSSPLYKLDPFVDNEGILRVGGRLRHSGLNFEEKHPIILPKNHHISRLIIEYHHMRVHHQGRLITHGVVRSAGYWIIGGQSKVSDTISGCVTCRKLRGKRNTQKMADLPADRLECLPPFTNVGFDVFGPWLVSTRKLRGGAVQNKRWALLLTCLVSRAIHIEILESMDSSSFVSALRRFFAIRGPAAILRCDRGTNFVGGKSELEDSLHQMNNRSVERFVTEYGCKWEFNPPHSSHHGGVWERQIGTIRRILDAMFLELGHDQLTNEILVTFMAEITGIVNSRPISALSTDADEPLPLSPSMLLTQKTRPFTPVPGDFIRQDLYSRRRWRRIQYLADQFWVRWRREYVQNLQSRDKWQVPQRSVRTGDVVMMKDDSTRRYMWPLGRVIRTYDSKDGKVRKADVNVAKDGSIKCYTRPITDFVVVVKVEETTDAE